MPEKKFHCLVVDTTAFIHNVSLQDFADFLITVPEVINEIKNKRQLKRLCVLPYELTVDEPSQASVQHVIDFAKKTGDYLSLSLADIKVIALTYQLEKELIGTAHLRTEPIMAKTIASRDKPPELLDSTPIVGFYKPPNAEELHEKSLLIADTINEVAADKDNGEKVADVKSDIQETEDRDDNEESDPIETEVTEVVLDDSDKDSEEDEELKKQLEALAIESSENDVVENMLVKIQDGPQIKSVNKNSDEEDESDDDEEEDEDDEDEDEDDDGSSWITPSNLTKAKSSFGKNLSEDDKVVRVACMSTDYSVQNVLKQINLNITSLDGKVIKQLRTYILRCYGCFKTTSLMTKVFCPRCGHKTLKRVAVSLDENGQQVIHINTRRPITAKGKNTSIPRPRGGKHSTNPILFEDQRIPKQMPSRVARTKTNALEEDYIAGYSPFVRRDVDSKSALLRAKGGCTNIKQWARNHEFRNLKRSQKK